MRRSAAHTVLVLALCSAAWAAESPVAVSPGSAEGTMIAERCPTFHWIAVEGAESVELVVYRVPKEESNGQLDRVLLVTLPGAAQGWTPSLDQCVERGGRYAWTLRAVTGKGLSDRSAPMFFEVTSRSSAEEIATALGVVRRYLAADAGTVPFLPT